MGRTESKRRGLCFPQMRKLGFYFQEAKLGFLSLFNNEGQFFILEKEEMSSCSAIIRSMETNEISWQQKPRSGNDKRKDVSPWVVTQLDATLFLDGPTI
jgi:hypothetical protein